MLTGGRLAKHRASRLARLLDAVFGPHCPRCPARIYPRDLAAHAKDCS